MAFDEQDLTSHARFLRGLAGSLTRDGAQADDAVQETWLATLSKRPDASRPLRPWLSRVLRNALGKLRRKDRRVAAREQVAARPEQAPDATTLAERSRLLRRLLDEVLALPDVERESVLLRYYEGRAPREIAALLGAPVEVVYRRLEHALEHLRARMDAAHGGERRPWCLGLVGALGLPRDLFGPVTAAATGAASGSALGTATATSGGLGLSSGGAAAFTGAFLMGATATTVTAAVVCLGAGLGLGWFVGSRSADDASSAPSRASAPSEAGGGLEVGTAPALQGSEAAQRAATLQAEVTTLREKNRALEAEKVAWERERALVAQPFDPKAMRFGLVGATPVFDQADWTELSGHMVEMAKTMPRLAAALGAGEEVPGDLQHDLQEHNMPLAIFAVAASKELKGTGPNGAYTHPAVIANLIRAALLAANDPLTSAQESQIVSVGNAWVGEMERATAALGSEAPALAHTIAEVDAKQRFLQGAKALLTPSQRTVLFHPETEGRIGMDLLSPALVYMAHSGVWSLTADELPLKAMTTLLASAGLKDADATPFLGVGQRWVSELPGALDARLMRDMDLMFPRVEAMQTYARAQMGAIVRTLEQGRLTTDQGERLRKLTTVLTPQVFRNP